jgi:hypothetical protein
MISVFVLDGGDCGFDPGRVKPKTINWHLLLFCLRNKSKEAGKCARVERYVYTPTVVPE